MKKTSNILCLFFILSMFYGCASFEPPNAAVKKPDNSFAIERDSIVMALQFMTKQETADYCKTYFQKPVIIAFVSVENKSTTAIQYSGDGLWNNELDEYVGRPITQISKYAEVAACLVPIVVFTVKKPAAAEPSVYSFIPFMLTSINLAVNTSKEDEILEYYKRYNLRSNVNWLLKPAEQKLFVLYFDGKKSGDIRISFTKTATATDVQFPFRLVAAGN